MHPLSETLPALYGRIPLGMRLGLDAMRAACDRFGRPERAFPAVHVAGTNGKGSTSAMLEAIARAAGLRTGLFTSPHLCRFAERIRIDGVPLSDDALSDALARALSDRANLSFFESATLAAFLAFRDARVDLAIVEVGLGGRLDATNVLPAPRASAITRIAFDHSDRLGPTLADIAREKAGIAKPGIDIVLGPMTPDIIAVIRDTAHAAGATVTSSLDLCSPSMLPKTLGLAGDHQRDNACVAYVLGSRIGASPSAIVHGLANVTWPGRLERIGRYLLDAAHNPDGAAALARYVRSLPAAPDRIALIFGALADKPWRGMLAALAPLAPSDAMRIYVAPRSSGGRAGVTPLELNQVAKGMLAGSVAEALAVAAADLVIVTGSMLLVGEVRASLLGLPRDPPVAL